MTGKSLGQQQFYPCTANQEDGVTLRQMIAMRLMQSAVAANTDWDYDEDESQEQANAVAIVEQTDALLDELAKEAT